MLYSPNKVAEFENKISRNPYDLELTYSPSHGTIKWCVISQSVDTRNQSRGCVPGLFLLTLHVMIYVLAYTCMSVSDICRSIVQGAIKSTNNNIWHQAITLVPFLTMIIKTGTYS